MLHRKAGNSKQLSTVTSRSGSAFDLKKNQSAFDAKKRKPGPESEIDDNKDLVRASRKALPCSSDCNTCPIPTLLCHYFEH